MSGGIRAATRRPSNTLRVWGNPYESRFQAQPVSIGAQYRPVRQPPKSFVAAIQRRYHYAILGAFSMNSGCSKVVKTLWSLFFNRDVWFCYPQDQIVKTLQSLVVFCETVYKALCFNFTQNESNFWTLARGHWKKSRASSIPSGEGPQV